MRLVLELSDLGNSHLKSRERRSGASVFSLAEGEGMATVACSSPSASGKFFIPLCGGGRSTSTGLTSRHRIVSLRLDYESGYNSMHMCYNRHWAPTACVLRPAQPVYG